MQMKKELNFIKINNSKVDITYSINGVSTESLSHVFTKQEQQYDQEQELKHDVLGYWRFEFEEVVTLVPKYKKISSVVKDPESAGTMIFYENFAFKDDRNIEQMKSFLGNAYPKS